MPITQPVSLEEVLAELNKLDRATVVTGLQTQAQPIFQEVYNRGVGMATARATTEKTELEGRIAGYEEQIRNFQTQIQQLTDKSPDAKKVREELEAKILEIQEQHKAEIRKLNAVLKTERVSRAKVDLKSRLVAAGVDPDYAEVLTNKPDVEKRLRFSDAGKLDVLQTDGEIPFAPVQGKDGIDLLADELKAATPPKFLTVNDDRGGGTPAAGGGATGGGNTEKKFYDGIRESAKQRSESQGDRKSAKERMGIKSSS